VSASRLRAILSTTPGQRWRSQTVRYATVTDSLIDMLEDRLCALEEVEATRWPARIVVRARLGRTLRASIVPFPGASFRDRRLEAVTNEWLSE